MKINNKTVVGDYFAYDLCHKIYILESSKDVEDARKMGYEVFAISKIKETFKKSCSLKFISNWSLDNQFVRQFQKAIFRD